MRSITQSADRTKFLSVSTALVAILSVILALGLFTAPADDGKADQNFEVVAVRQALPSNFPRLKMEPLDRNGIERLLVAKSSRESTGNRSSKITKRWSEILVTLIFLLSCANIYILTINNTVLTRAKNGPDVRGRMSPPHPEEHPMAKKSGKKIYWKDPDSDYESDMTDEESRAFLIEIGVLKPDGTLAEGIQGKNLSHENPLK